MEVLVQFHVHPSGADLRVLGQLTRSAVRETLVAAGAPGDCETSVLYVHDDEMRRLNAEYRGMDRSTDVLAFAMRESGGAPARDDGAQNEMLGDVVISLDAAARQAASRDHSLRREVAILLIHGVLHLVGHDHAGSAAAGRGRAKAMREMEKRCMDALESKMIV